MTQQPEALRLAALLDEGNTVRPTQISTPLSNVAVYRKHTAEAAAEAAAELRRLATVEAQRDALLEALKLARLMLIAHGESHAKIDDAIKAMEGQT